VTADAWPRHLEALRRELPEGAPILAVPTVRARDRAEVRQGRVFDLGLASPLFAPPTMGFVELPRARVFIGRGMLDPPALIARLRATSASDEPPVHGEDRTLIQIAPAPVLIADDLDERALSACLTGVEGLPRVAAVLTPTRTGQGIDALSRALAPNASVALLATPDAVFVSGPSLSGSGAVGLLFLGGDDPGSARARCAAARAALASDAGFCIA